jgi:hypothetical protein
VRADQWPPAPSPRNDRPPRLQTISWLTLAAAAIVAAAAIALFPRSGGDAPPLGALALIGAVVTAVLTVALYAIVRRDLRLPSLVAASFAVAFALIGVVKFVLAPSGLYEINAVRSLDDLFGSVANPAGAAFTGVAVFALYALGYRLATRLGHGDAPWRRRRSADRRSRGGGLTLALLLVVLIVITGGGIALFAMLVLTAPRQYLEFVFSSWAGLGITVALIAAATLIHQVFARLGRRPELVAEIGTIVTLFWLGLGFLALYHVLWIVYVLVLGSIWPLRTVTPK